MKQVLIILACLVVSTLSMAQKSNVRMMKVRTNVGEQAFVVNDIEEITFEFGDFEKNHGLENGYEYVDLGLPSGLLWATCNIGADKPEDYGDYFAWGETAPKTFYDWDSENPYKHGIHNWGDEGNNGMTKYNITDNNDELDPEDDAAAANWSGAWRMPKQEEWNQLFENSELDCEWIEGEGYKITSKIAGHEGAVLFLPAAGKRSGLKSESVSQKCFYWSSSLRKLEEYSSFAWSTEVDKDNCNANTSSQRFNGMSVRPVCSPAASLPEE